MHQRNRRLFVVAIVATIAFNSAAGASAAPATRVLVETDPVPFFFDGFAVHLRIAPAATPGWTLGAGAYAMDLPDLLVGAAPANHDEGWHQRIRAAYGVFIDRDLDGSRDGAFVGLQVALQQLALTRDNADGAAAHYPAGLAMARVGYLWFPTRTGLYLMPWAGLGITAALGGESDLAGERYHPFPVVAFAAIHVGWRL
jgi:hypothetical protein